MECKLLIRQLVLSLSPGASLSCEESAFACVSGDKCVPKVWKCDSEHDCVDGSDEADCGRKFFI